MNLRHPLLVLLVALSMLAPACGAGDTPGRGAGDSPGNRALTVYSADGLGVWLRSQFDAFTTATGVAVNLVEGGSGEIVERARNEGSDPQADLLIVLPPFIQKAAQSGLLQPGDADTTGITSPLVGPAGIYVPIVNNALCFIANPGADPQPASWDDLLKPEFKGRLQYSTPGEAGDGTAMLLLLQHLKGKPAALDFLAKLQTNNVGPAPSTGMLQPKVSSGQLLVANGDVQMNLASIKNDGSRFNIFFPAMPDGSRTTISLPYVAGVMARTPQPDEAKKLLAFLLSKDVQNTVSAGAQGIPVLKALAADVPGDPDAMTAAGLLDDVRVWVPEWTSVLADIDYDINAYQRAIGN